ncbi:tail assembly protein [Xanthomonas hortorum]|uniref:tail assembly protein n=1 Tax=Xanthomonas hortorum TaxID=56454 RepID=UPI0015D5CD39|nr:tail assembly protein [Xanthomonas hortorum]MCC8495752.1 tail assembly protein [Xanthomonas hortorum pv. gardneri]MCE4529680.1 tail assembly protein [Xanthomonas hortorum pv. vitians]NMI19896.1 tail assembly protein [Xanthomonas hortorum pv. vitians]
MNPKIRTVRLYGVLGARYGRCFKLAVSSPAEAVHALCVQIPGLERFLMESKDRGMAFAVFLGRRNLREDQLEDPPGSDEIRIAPILIGSKSGGVFQTILGVALIAVAAVAVVASGGTVAGVFAAGGVWGTTALVGLSLTIGGVAQMLAPQAKGLGTSERPENQPSYSFNGPVNTQAQGNPVPVAYGRVWAGGAIISAGIYAEDQA